MRARLALMLLWLATGPAAAEGLGWGRLFSNDGLGDAQDRWRTGAWTLSRVWGPDWNGRLPARPGEIVELRFHSEIIAPANLERPGRNDRRYAGILSLGLHTHYEQRGWQVSLGADLVFTGPQTGMDDLQSAIHRTLGVASPEAAAARQIPDAVYPTLVVELGREVDLGPARLRPFVEGQAGLETLLRAGADLTFGGHGAGGLMLREITTGQRYRGIAGAAPPGLSLTLGADIARVWDSALLPDGGSAVLSPSRSRLRAGVAWQGRGGASAFYGLSWLSREFRGQPEAQLVGSLTFNLRF